ncbi:hypothetical protein JHK85_039518 [Glycine max]|nr:hypothetical protein JHK85_039518 [Glycine max]
MEKLANSFSVLELDADDSHVPTTADISDKRVNADVDIVPVKSEKQNQENPVTPSCEYKLPLVWIDLEMTGLTKKVLKSTISEGEAEEQVIEFVKRYVNVGSHTPHLAGNSIYVDFQFLKKYMPKLASLFSHVLVDVSSVKALCIRWYPKDQKRAPSKLNRHRALDDIRESIEELRYYKANIFKPKSRKS